MSRRMKKNKIVQLVLLIVILLVFIAINIACMIYEPLITTYLYGYGIDSSNLDYSVGEDVGEEIEGEGAVLLKNDRSALPLKQTKVSVFGWGATDAGFVLSGSGSGASGTTGTATSFLAALENEGIEYYEPLMEKTAAYRDKRQTKGTAAFEITEWEVDSATMAAAAQYSDTAIYVISRTAVETNDIPRVQYIYNQSTADTTRTYLEISEKEQNLLDAITDNFSTVIVILNTCNTMELGFLEDSGVDAALFVGAAGKTGANAIAKILKGEINPSGKLSDTYAYDLSTAASYANSANGSETSADYGVQTYIDGGNYVDYAEGIYVGYRWYETADAEGFWDSQFAYDYWGVSGYDEVVQYPFGYGLSYTQFSWTLDSVSPADGSVIDADTVIEITLTVENTGNYAGKDVVQVYYGGEYYQYGIEKSSKNLCAFAKTDELGADGGSQQITLSFTASDMASYDSGCLITDNGGYVLESGEYTITVGSDSHDSAFTLTYNVDSDIILDGAENAFTGSSALDGVSVDGTDNNQNITYLSRSAVASSEYTETVAFVATFPKTAVKSRSLSLSGVTTAATLKTDTQTYETGVDSGLRLYDDDGNVNEDLLYELGSDYDAEIWTTFLNQLTISDMKTLICNGGYGTLAISSIGKPRFYDFDGPAGINDSVMTVNNVDLNYYPCETVMACSWNAELSYLYGQTIGEEAAAINVAGWYAPAVNIHRSPFDGRNYEYYSEDPYLSGVMAANTIQGATSKGLYCYIKHFALNETEESREGLYTWLTEQTLREIYLKPFEIAVKDGGANAIMSSFNRIGSVWTGGSYALLTQVLRNEWGFRGTVVTDNYAGATELMNVDLGLRAGNDLWLNYNNNGGTLGSLTDDSSTAAISAMRDACHNILYTYCNTAYLADEALNKAVTGVSATWLYYLVAIDVVVAILLILWGCSIFISPETRKRWKENRAAKRAAKASDTEKRDE